MATIKYRARGSSPKASITLKLSLGRNKVFEKKTGLIIDPKEWSVDTNLPKQAKANNKKLSNDLRKLSAYIFDCVNEAQKDGTTINSNWLGTQIDIHFKRINPIGKSELVTDAIQHVIDTADIRKNQLNELGLSKSRINSYEALLRIFKDFQGGNNYKVKEVNVSLGKEFLSYLLNDCKYSKSYALRTMGNLKTVCYDADINGIEISKQVRKIESGKPSNEFVIYLTPLELKKIEKADIMQPHLQNARKWLLLGCSIGQRVSDLLNITEKNFVVKDGLELIKLKQKKTGKNVSIPVLDATKEIIKYGLPQKISSQKFNEYIKKVCEKAEINELITGSLMDKKTKRKKVGQYPKWKLISSHVCRRSFATNLYGELPTPLIMQITQHSTEKNLLAYMGKSNDDYAQQIADYYDKQKAKAKKEPQLSVVSNVINQ
ncbi:phage integrase SAM-like domain-containing protein [Aurantibacter crassamenti]|uniref:tyrosine-type recombinase/integrase n=1 Tax=Aurantibacter crassamenti TaxID=1837375 RepID=UPI00193950CD|nr:tyrosine-type recombinase/integrase [Aurantibacter crassamenti]MBM1106037.1 phage integrase SAM-like domain-containing protein [Aurantibacter crassamenti]